MGSGKSDKINYTQVEKVFHVGDVSDEVKFSKKATNDSKRNNILGVRRDAWNVSTAPGVEGVAYGGGDTLKIQLAKVR